MTPEQKAARRAVITATDVRKILGVSPYNETALECYMDKLNLLPDVEETDAMRLGKLMEPVIQEMFRAKTGLSVRQETSLVANNEAKWIAASPDAWACSLDLPISKRELPLPCEWKSTTVRDGWGESGTDEVPEFVALQSHWQQLACGAEGGYVAAIICGEFRHYAIPHRPDILDMLKSTCWEFYQRVQERRPPEPDWSCPRTPDLIKLLHKPREGVTVAADELVQAYAAELERVDWLRKEAASVVKDREAERDELRAKIILATDGASQIVLPDGRYIERKAIDRAGYTVKPTTYEQFKIVTPKGRK